MTRQKSNIVLIGMPGSGKSTVGVLLAKRTSHGFIDTDVLVQTARGRSLQGIVDTDGYMALRRIEQEILLSLDCRNHVIATGGSAVYSPAAMEHLKLEGLVFFLETDLTTLVSRVRDFETRGLAKRQDQTLADLYTERSPLYEKYADVIVSCANLTHEEVCARIMEELRRYTEE
ncbi:MAG TPA: shikimate kinase [Syntrophorhabdales bacterium]|nr:shikimate kinase [Syntrophorhabdales bacterium]